MKKAWLLSLLFLIGCTELEEESVVPKIKTEQQVLEEIVAQLQQKQLVLGETEQQDLSDYEQINENHFMDADIAIQTTDTIVDQLTVTLAQPVAVDDIAATFTVEEGVQGQWLVAEGEVTALQLTRTEPTLKQQVYGLPLDEKVGQLLMIGMDGTTISAELEQVLAQHIGHVILFKKNIVSMEQLRGLITSIDALETAYPVWIGIDEEGGRVSRLPTELVKIPSAQALAVSYSVEQVEAIAQKLGEALASNGIDIDFAPVMDVNSNASNPVIGDRAFSANADTVSDYAGHVAKGLQQAGVLAVAKHFPGHGDTAVDSHIGLPVIEKSLEQLEQMELRPFRQAVEDGIGSIMIGHLLVPALDANEPASLSANIVTGLLREQWQYDGIIITDDLTMGALGRPLPQAILAAIQAGNDIALANGSLADVLAGQRLVMQAIEEGVIPLQQINASAYRIISSKQERGLQDFSVQQWNHEMQILLQ